MAKAKSGNTVQIHYTGSLNDGSVFSKSGDNDPLQFTIGGGEVIRVIEEAVIGMAPGESKNLSVMGFEAFGPYREELVVPVQRNQIPAEIEPKVGQILQIQRPDGELTQATVTEVSESHILLDQNHPLVNEKLLFDIKLIQIE